MNRTPVTSSSIASIGYDRDNNTLEVEFRNGRCYRYFAVPQHVADGLILDFGRTGFWRPREPAA